MVHAVQPPQHRHRMEQHVLEVDREIEDDDRCRDSSHAGSVITLSRPQPCASPTSATPTAAVGKSTPHHERVDHDDADIVGPSRPAADRLSRRGASASHSAMTAKTLAKDARRISGSLGRSSLHASDGFARRRAARRRDHRTRHQQEWQRGQIDALPAEMMQQPAGAKEAATTTPRIRKSLVAWTLAFSDGR